MSDDAPTLPNDPSARGGQTAVLAPGTRLQEFEITGLVGEGGFGIVYEAMDTQLNRRVAVKEYMPSQLASRVNPRTVKVRSIEFAETFDAGLKSFIQEARMLAQFKHPALVEVFRFWEENGTAYMAMPLYDGPTLKTYLAGHPEMANERWLRGMLAPVLDALEHMHGMQVYHRDIAPDNLLILKNGAPLLLDLGGARRVISDMTQALTVILKPGYAPIEQYADDPAVRQGPWTDIYALAAVIYFAIARRAPPPAVSRMLKDPLKLLAAMAPAGFNPEFLAAIDRGLAVRPEARPQTIEEFRTLLGVQSFAMTMAPSTLTSAAQAAQANTPTQSAAPATSTAKAPIRETANNRPATAPGPADLEKSQPLATPPRSLAAESAVNDPAPQAPSPASAPSPGSAPSPASAPSPGSAATPATARARTAALSPPASPASPTLEAARKPGGSGMPPRASPPHTGSSQTGGQQSRSPLPIVVGVVVALLGSAGLAWYLGRPDKLPVEASPSAVKSAEASASATSPLPASPPATAAAPTPAPAPAPAAAVPPTAVPPTAASAPADRSTPDNAAASPKPDITQPTAPPVAPAPVPGSSAALPGAAVAAASSPTAQPTPGIEEKRGSLQIAVRPWADVFVNGVRRGTSPPIKRLTLPEGNYQIELRNPGGPAVTRQIEIKANQSVSIDHQF